jgi:photosystem II stability/assembly factor-like uncharacterized protein
MKFKTIYLLCLGLLSAQAAPQSFTRIAPLPTARNLTGVSFTSPNVGWIVGEAHNCFRTNDGGASWTPVALPGPASEPFYSVDFVDSSLGFASGNSGTSYRDIYRTTDGGVTWQPVNSFPLGGSWRQIDFVSGTTGFMGANGGLVRTSDAGQNWQLRSGYPDCPVVYGMDFRDENVGLASGYVPATSQDGVFKTSDGGVTWTRKLASGSNDVIFLSDSVALATAGTQIYRSQDAGETWTPTGATITTGLMDIERVTSTVIAGVSGSGDVWLSIDGGFSWSQKLEGEGDLPADWAVRFSDAQRGKVVGQGGAIFSTEDGGLTWSRLNRGIGRDWNAIVALSDTNLVLAGHHGYVQTSNDGGAHWTTQILDPPTFGRDTSFSDMAVLGPSSIMAVGHWGSLFRSQDGGASWENMSSALNPSYYPNAITFTDALNGWIAGWDYNTGPKSYVRRTSDGGLTWQTVENVNVPSVDVDFRGNIGWVLTSGTPFWRTTDAGQTWAVTSLPLTDGSPPSISQMSWSSAQIGYVVGWDGYLARTTDAGATWQRVLPFTSNFVYLGVLAIGNNEVWICGASQGGGNAVVRRSIDGGATWRTWSLPGQYTTPYRIARAGDKVYVVGYDGDVWKMDLGSSEIAPTQYSMFRGTWESGGVQELSTSNDAYFAAKPGPVLSITEWPASVVIEGVSPVASPSDLRLTLEAKVSTVTLGQRVEFWDYVAGNWVVVGTSTATRADSVLVTGAVTSPSRFVQAGTGAVKARLSWKATGPVLSYPWRVSIDRSTWQATP